MAWGMLRQRLAADGLADEVSVSSAGVYGVDGSGASEPGVEVLAERGIDISDHVAHTVTQREIAEADLVLVMEEGNLVQPDEYRRLVKDIHQSQFEQLLTIRDGGDDIGFYIREKGDTITDVVLLVNGSDGFILLSLEGLLKFSDLNDLHIDVEGANHFEKLPEKKKDVPRA